MKLIHLIYWINKLTLCADLTEVFKQIGEGARDNATITVALSTSCDGKGLPTACLAIGKYGAIIASQHTVQTHTDTNTHIDEHKSQSIFGNTKYTEKKHYVCDILIIFYKRQI